MVQLNVERKCPIRYTLDIVGGKWKLAIICMLASGEAVRYGVIKRKLVGVSNMMLAQSLKELEAHGIVNRKQYNEIPPKVEYSLTQDGLNLISALQMFASWGIDNMKQNSKVLPYCEDCQSVC